MELKHLYHKLELGKYASVILCSVVFMYINFVSEFKIVFVYLLVIALKISVEFSSQLFAECAEETVGGD